MFKCCFKGKEKEGVTRHSWEKEQAAELTNTTGRTCISPANEESVNAGACPAKTSRESFVNYTPPSAQTPAATSEAHVSQSSSEATTTDRDSPLSSSSDCISMEHASSESVHAQGGQVYGSVH